MATVRIQLQTIPSLNDPDKTYLLGYYEQAGAKVASFMERVGTEHKWRTLPVPDEFKRTVQDLTALEEMVLERGFILLEPQVISRG